MENNQNLGSFTIMNDSQNNDNKQEISFQPLDNTQATPAAPTAEAQQQAVPTTAPATPAPQVNMDFASLLATTEAADPSETVYRKLPEGTHYVKFAEIEFTTTKADKPIVWLRYKAVGGENDGIMLSESFYLGGDEVWQVQRSIGNMKHRLEVDMGLTNLPWAVGFANQGNTSGVIETVNALAASLHFHATVVYNVDAKTGEKSEYATIESIVRA